MIHDWRIVEFENEIVFTRPSTGAVYTFGRVDGGWLATIVRSRDSEPIAEHWTDVQLAELKAQITK